MATPGYPQMGQMPPMGGPGAPGMGGPPMGGPPMGGPPMGGPTGMMRPVRRGTSKAVPVVVSAGLAVGVFCGLLFGVGTGKKSAAAAPSASNVKKIEEGKTAVGTAPEGLGATTTTPVATKPVTPPTTTTVPPATGSATPTVAGGSATPTPPTTPAVPQPKLVKLTITTKPEVKDAKVTIDDKDIEGMSAEIPADKKSVKLVVKANGYHTYEKKLDIVGDSTMSIEIELQKKPSGGGTPTVRPPKRPDRPPSNNGGGLIDI